MGMSILKTKIEIIKYIASSNNEKLSSNDGTNYMENGNGIEIIKELLVTEIGETAHAYLHKNIDLSNNVTMLQSTSTRFNVEKINLNKFKNIVNIKRVNDIRWLNKFFEVVNSKLPIDGIFIGCVETKRERKARILRKSPSPFNWLHYSIDFIHKRIAPKIWLTKRLYFSLTKGKNRVITKAETLGRLISCGFKIIDEVEINNYTWFVVKKVSLPLYDNNPSYGPIYKMPRIGKNGKIINVYKLRTMHPFSEYLQEYMIEKYGYDNEGKGKIKNDFRATTLGSFFRRYWLDELPQLINVFKGEMVLVGVRPLSRTRFNEFPDEMKKRRTQFKPGCFPPYVALLMPNEEDNIKAEKIYLDQKEKHPFWTDIKFFWLSVYNIVTNKIRSA